MGPRFISAEGDSNVHCWRQGMPLQWGRASSARKARFQKNSRAPPRTFNGAALHQRGRRCDEQGRPAGTQPSMGPRFISAEGDLTSYAWRVTPYLQWGRASSARKADGVAIAAGGLIALQWGRASSARKAYSFGTITANANILQWGRASSARKAWIGRSSPTLRPSFNGAALISAEGTEQFMLYQVPTILQWGRASSARKAALLTGGIDAELLLQWGRASSARKAARRRRGDVGPTFLQWGRASSARKARCPFSLLFLAEKDLQWGRASSARKARS